MKKILYLILAIGLLLITVPDPDPISHEGDYGYVVQGVDLTSLDVSRETDIDHFQHFKSQLLKFNLPAKVPKDGIETPLFLIAFWQDYTDMYLGSTDKQIRDSIAKARAKPFGNSSFYKVLLC